MKKLVGLLIVLSLAASVHAGLDISFSSDNGGNWSYTAETEGIGTFSFGVADIDILPDVYTPVTPNDSISIGSIKVENLSEVATGIFMGDINTSSLTLIKITGGNGKGTTRFEGMLNEGTVVVVGETASFYPGLGDDITNAVWNDGDWVGLDMGFSLTLQGAIDIAGMILHSNENTPLITGGTYSGSMTVPEPATFFILALGSVLFLKKE